MTPDRRVPEQLDVPLVWELEPSPAASPREDDPFPQQPDCTPAGSGRLLLAALVDIGVVIAWVGCAWAVAVVGGAELNPWQLGLSGIFGLEVATVTAVAAVFGWRATPGMLLAGVEVANPVPLGRAVGAWSLWMLLLPLFGAPLLVGRKGRRPLERLVGAPAIPRSRPAAS